MHPAINVTMTDVVFPEAANHYGTLFAGNALSIMCKAAFAASSAYAQSRVVMASCEKVAFLKPVPLGHMLQVDARITRIGRASLTVEVDGKTAPYLGAESCAALKGEFTMVCVDDHGRPTGFSFSNDRDETNESA